MMSIATLTPPTRHAMTVAELVERLGNIPLDRIRTQPALGTATEEDVVVVKNCELLEGVIVEMAMGWEEATIETELIGLIRDYLKQNRIAVLAGPDGLTRLAPGRVRIPDIGVYLLSSFPGGKARRVAICDIAPDWAIEVLSRSNTPAEMRRKRSDFFAAGTRRLWIVDPRQRTIEDWTSAATMTVLASGDVADVGEILPGFTLDVGALFRELDDVFDSQTHPADDA